MIYSKLENNNYWKTSDFLISKSASFITDLCDNLHAERKLILINYNKTMFISSKPFTLIVEK